MRGRARAVFLAAGAALLVATLGGLSTDIGPWYQSLKQPPWKPSDMWFGPVWTTIFALTAIAGYLAWTRASTPGGRDSVLAATAFNGALNVGWSLLFFRLRRPDWALYEVAALWLSIVVMMLVFGRHSRLAALLLVPYLAWVSFAAVLNATVVRLNGPFAP